MFARSIVKRIEQREEVHGGLYIPDSAKEKPREGEVLAVGPGKRLEDGKVVQTMTLRMEDGRRLFTHRNRDGGNTVTKWIGCQRHDSSQLSALSFQPRGFQS